MSLLDEGLSQLGLPDAQAAGASLERYLEELERWNPRFGFVKADSREELVVKHVLDSLAPWRIVQAEAGGDRVLDVGSGAGFPGLPLAVALPGVSFILLERSTKKVSFLRTCKALLGLARVEVVQGDLASVKEPPRVVTFRAVATLSRFLEDARSAGLGFRALVAYKGRAERARQEIEDVQRSTDRALEAEIVPVRVPFLQEERCIVVLRR